jgi:hypothetical protein
MLLTRFQDQLLAVQNRGRVFTFDDLCGRSRIFIWKIGEVEVELNLVVAAAAAAVAAGAHNLNLSGEVR